MFLQAFLSTVGDTQEFLRIGQDYVDALAWPLAVGAVCIIVGRTFRTQIAAILARIQSIDVTATGARINTFPPQQELGPENEALPPGEPPAPDEPPPQPPPGTTSHEVDAMLVTDPAARALEENNRRWAETVNWYAYNWLFERVYRTIYGSQIALLEHLEVKPDFDEKKNLIVYYGHHIGQATQSNPNYTYPWESYIQYLKGLNLIQEDRPDNFVITDVGKAFLAWARSEKVGPKPF